MEERLVGGKVEGGGVIMDWTMDLGHKRVGDRQLQEHIRR